MEQKEIIGVLFKRNENSQLAITQRKIKGDILNKYCELLKCSKIGKKERIINGKTYNFIYDDEVLINGKTKTPLNVVAVGIQENKILELFFYSVLIVGTTNEKGEEESLNEEDINAIQESVIMLTPNEEKTPYLIALKYTF